MPDWVMHLDRSSLTDFLRQSLWAIPALEILHLVGLVFTIGGAASVDLRLLGRGQNIDIRALLQLLLPFTGLGFAIAASSGVLLFTAAPAELYVNPIFRLKLGLLGVAGSNAFLFHRFVYRSLTNASSGKAKMSALLSLVVWCIVLICGYLIQYF